MTLELAPKGKFLPLLAPGRENCLLAPQKNRIQQSLNIGVHRSQMVGNMVGGKKVGEDCWPYSLC